MPKTSICKYLLGMHLLDWCDPEAEVINRIQAQLNKVSCSSLAFILYSKLRRGNNRLDNKCMSTHLNSNANVYLDSNANAIFQERIQMQMFWVRTQIQLFWLHISKCILINFKCVGVRLTFCFIWRINNVM